VVKLLESHRITSNVRMRADSTPPVAELKFYRSSIGRSASRPS
jgi:hypothetical protein